MYDALGRCQLNLPVSESGDESVVDVRRLAAGVYTLTTEGEKPIRFVVIK